MQRQDLRQTTPLMSTTADLNYLVLSDIHIGHRRNKAFDIISNLDSFFDDYSSKSRFVGLKIIFIAGDLFDRMLEFSSDDAHLAAHWLDRLMRFCARYGIKLRILEGTPSHDREQSRIAQTVYEIVKCGVDFKYVDTLHIEYIAELKLNVLYVPDEYSSSASQTLEEVRELMKLLNISEVDIAIMHGCFNFQLGNIPHNIQVHDERAYLSIVKSFINIGHIHGYSVYERIVAQGSFDRLAHNEEEAKGGVVMTLSPNGNNRHVFIENKRAKIFKTITLRGEDIDKCLRQIEKALDPLPFDSHIQIKARKLHPLYIAFDELVKRHPCYNFKKFSLEDEQQSKDLLSTTIALDKTYIKVEITRANIVSLLSHEIRTKHQLSERQMSLLQTTLEKIRG